MKIPVIRITPSPDDRYDEVIIPLKDDPNCDEAFSTAIEVVEQMFERFSNLDDFDDIDQINSLNKLHIEKIMMEEEDIPSKED